MRTVSVKRFSRSVSFGPFIARIHITQVARAAGMLSVR